MLLDVVLPDQRYLENSKDRLTHYSSQGRLIISEIVYAELSCQFVDQNILYSLLRDTGIELASSPEKALQLAGNAWLNYSKKRTKNELICPACGGKNSVLCKKCGQQLTMRQHIISDFLIGAHAQVLSDGLLTRDRGVYKKYFPFLRIL